MVLPYPVLEGLSSPRGGSAALPQAWLRCASAGGAAPREACVNIRGEACQPVGGAGVLHGMHSRGAGGRSDKHALGGSYTALSRTNHIGIALYASRVTLCVRRARRDLRGGELHPLVDLSKWETAVDGSDKDAA